MARARTIICLGLLLIIGLFSDTVSGQDRARRSDASTEGQLKPPPLHFGDTPSPTEMMARLKFHKQQQTPLFDLLRESGVDVFSQLSDDQKKLVGRYVEDIILKEGLDSEKLSPLMKEMNIDPDMKQALQDGLKRSGINDSESTPEQRKNFADAINKLHKEFSKRPKPPSQRNSSRQPILGPLTNPNRGQSNQTRGQATNQNRESQAEKDRREEMAISNRDQAGDRSSEPRSSQTDRSESPDDIAKRPQERIRAEGGLAKATGKTDPGATDPSNSQPESTPQDRTLGSPSTSRPNNSRPSSSLPRSQQPAKQALGQIESKLLGSKKEILSKFKNKIQEGDTSRQEIGEVLSDLKNSKSSSDFARRLEQAGEKLDLPVKAREEMRELYNSLSRTDKSIMREAFKEVPDGLLKQLADSPPGQASRYQKPGARPANQRNQQEIDVAALMKNLPVEDLGENFLKSALKTYDDAESGYQLPPAYKRLKDQAEGVFSEREMVNLGDLSTKLLENGSKLFDIDSATKKDRPAGVKPGQRMDQIFAAAAEKAIAGANGGKGKNESFFSKALNGAFGVTLDKAVDIADKSKSERDQDPRPWDPGDRLNTPEQFNSFENFSGSQASSESSSPSASSSAGSSSNDQSSLDRTAAAIAESVSETKFDGWTFGFIVGLIAIVGVVVFLFLHFMPSADQTVKKQRELQRKLQNNSANPKDLVEAVDLFLLTRFGDASSWWNSKHAAEQITTSQPDWRDRVLSLFQVYRWSRYQADGNASVSAEQNELVNSTLKELSQAADESLATANASPKTELGITSGSGDEATS